MLPRLTTSDHTVIHGIVSDILGPSRTSELPHYDAIYSEKAIHNDIDLFWAPMVRDC